MYSIHFDNLTFFRLSLLNRNLNNKRRILKSKYLMIKHKFINYKYTITNKT